MVTERVRAYERLASEETWRGTHKYNTRRCAASCLAALYFWEACFGTSPGFTLELVAGPLTERTRRRNSETTINPAPTIPSVWVSGRAVSDVMIACTYWSTASTVPKAVVCKGCILSHLRYSTAGTLRRLGNAMGFRGISLPNFPKMRRVTARRLSPRGLAGKRRSKIRALANTFFEGAF